MHPNLRIGEPHKNWHDVLMEKKETRAKQELTQATAIMDTIFDEFKALYVRDKHMEPKHGIFDKLFTRANKNYD